MDTEGFANALFESIEKMHTALLRFWEDSAAVLSLVGRLWLHAQANANSRDLVSGYLEVLYEVFRENPAEAIF